MTYDATKHGDTENQHQIDQLTALVEARNDEIEWLRLALDKLSRLGNEPMHGNSDGNLIAYRALYPSSVSDTPDPSGGDPVFPYRNQQSVTVAPEPEDGEETTG